MFILQQVARYADLSYAFHRAMIEFERGVPLPWLRVLNFGTVALRDRLVRGCRHFPRGTHVPYNHINH